jgi:hypothetical protein
MAGNDGIDGGVRSREEEYFRRKDRELVERMRQAAEAAQERQELEARSGLRDPVLLQELQALGFTAETVSLLPFVPIVQGAWAEGGVSADERALIAALARQRGIDEAGAAGRQLAAWLETRPSDEVFERATRLVAAILEDPSGAPHAPKIEDLIRQCEQVASSSGGVLGFRKVSAEERDLLTRIEAALRRR